MALRLVLVTLLGLAALGVGLIATVALQSEPARQAEGGGVPAADIAPASVTVLAAARAVQAGTLLKPEDLGTRALAPEEVPPDAFRDGPAIRAELPGAMVRRSLAPGDPLRAASLLRPGEHGFLAAVLTPGLRAVTVGVDVVTGAAGLIWPGDRVDVILTQHLEDAALPAARRHVGELVLAGARVIAVDRHLVQGAQPGGSEVMRDALRTVTLEVTPEQSTRLTLAGRMGRLSLALRAAAAPVAEESAGAAAAAAAQLARPVWGGDVSPALVRDPTQVAPPPPPSAMVRLIQGPEQVQEIRFR